MAEVMNRTRSPGLGTERQMMDAYRKLGYLTN